MDRCTKVNYIYCKTATEAQESCYKELDSLHLTATIIHMFTELINTKLILHIKLIVFLLFIFPSRIVFPPSYTAFFFQKRKYENIMDIILGNAPSMFCFSHPKIWWLNYTTHIEQSRENNINYYQCICCFLHAYWRATSFTQGNKNH